MFTTWKNSLEQAKAEEYKNSIKALIDTAKALATSPIQIVKRLMKCYSLT